MKFVGGPLDGQICPHPHEECPARLYVRAPIELASWVYYFQSADRITLTARDTPPDERTWVYDRVGDEYRVRT